MNFKNLKELRESKGIKQKFVCEKLGISRPAMTNKEKKKSPVSVSEANMLAEIYGEDYSTIVKLSRQY